MQSKRKFVQRIALIILTVTCFESQADLKARWVEKDSDFDWLIAKAQPLQENKTGSDRVARLYRSIKKELSGPDGIQTAVVVHDRWFQPIAFLRATDTEQKALVLYETEIYRWDGQYWDGQKSLYADTTPFNFAPNTPETSMYEVLLAARSLAKTKGHEVLLITVNPGAPLHNEDLLPIDSEFNWRQNQSYSGHSADYRIVSDLSKIWQQRAEPRSFYYRSVITRRFTSYLSWNEQTKKDEPGEPFWELLIALPLHDRFPGEERFRNYLKQAPYLADEVSSEREGSGSLAPEALALGVRDNPSKPEAGNSDSTAHYNTKDKVELEILTKGNGAFQLFPKVEHSLTGDLTTIEKTRVALQNPATKNGIVLGPSGSGKTVTVEHFVRELRKGKFPEWPKDTIVIETSRALLGSETLYSGQLEGKVMGIINAFTIAEAHKRKVLLIIDNFHTLDGCGVTETNSTDVLDILLPHLSRGNRPTIALSTMDDFNRLLKTRTDLIRCFTPVITKTLTQKELLERLDKWTRQHGITFPSSVLKEAIDLSSRFDAVGAQPAQALRLLGGYVGRLKVTPSKATPTIDAIREEAKMLYNLPDSDIEAKGLDAHLSRLETFLAERFVGQDHVKLAVANSEATRLLTMETTTRPAFAMFFVGGPGQAKTAFAREFGTSIGLDPKRHVTVINMAKFGSQSGVPVKRLLSEIAEAITYYSGAVVVLDELDRASLEAQEALLQMLESGELIAETKSGGWVHVNARYARFVATSNLGRHTEGDPSSIEARMQLQNSLKADDRLLEPLVDRLDLPIAFASLPQHDFRTLLTNHFDCEWLRIKKRHPNIKLSAASKREFLNQVVERLWSETGSNRPGLRIVTEHLSRFDVALTRLEEKKKAPKGDCGKLLLDGYQTSL